MKISSPDFENGGVIPERFSQNDANHSPQLDIRDVPPQAQSVVMIMDDPDAPSGTFTHWVVFDINPRSTAFHEAEHRKDVRFGKNSYGRAAYAGPKPPDGEHRYFFRAYALDTRLNLPNSSTRAEIEHEMNGHVLAQAEMMGRYATPTHAHS
jgi:Raf kinase inhibitor-like YbhB/YbcL family protein